MMNNGTTLKTEDLKPLSKVKTRRPGVLPAKG